uniref:Uncharacterized protein n=1 Tax=Arundo donax TaxID=35708 RepID=A0A0A9FEG0_ARUDO
MATRRVTRRHETPRRVPRLRHDAFPSAAGVEQLHVRLLPFPDTTVTRDYSIEHCLVREFLKLNRRQA